uniref:Uncharacterized protein n=1 Tax=Polytomella parva TaxID=51329 RepID=A0A7S0URR9_9CHLO|mmetsp:Transcript_19205/g.34750  ORF Transcript_19205/g.34750 Transcript_19205/m.34750 type:complete len:256 (+) Transcript_19205:48-815(+)
MIHSGFKIINYDLLPRKDIVVVAHCKRNPQKSKLAGLKETLECRSNINRRSNITCKSYSPWSVCYQLNERNIAWEDNVQIRLICSVLATRLNCTIEEVEQKLNEVGAVFPDMLTRLTTTKVDILESYINNLPVLAVRLLSFKTLLPGVNVSKMLSMNPKLLLDWDEHSLAERLSYLRRKLPGLRVELLVPDEPSILRADADALIDAAKRLLPNEDPLSAIATKPQMLLSMVDVGMDSAIDVEGSPFSSPRKTLPQ